jgi:hypothetical protein
MKLVQMTRDSLAGWRIVGWCALAVTSMSAAILATYGSGEPGLRAVIRGSAQTSFLLFTSAFAAAALAQTWPSRLSRWMRRNRRYLGVSFAVSHFIHLVAIVSLVRRLGDQAELDAPTLVSGGLAYVFSAAMTATSFDRSAAWIGPRAWRALHTAGVYYIWFIFFISYAPRAAIESVLYLPFVLILLAALALRVVARRRLRRRTTPVAAVIR